MSDKDKPICEVKGDFLPQYSYPGDAGADLQAGTDAVIPARGRALIPTGISVAIPQGYAGLVWPRSGLAVKQGLDSGAGVIDSQYRGEVKVLLFNHTDTDFKIKKGDRIAQLLIQKVESVQFTKVDELDDTHRGEGGFGSSGPS
ncbi:MAG: dUTP diphosphatase [Nitrospinales bacterium]